MDGWMLIQWMHGSDCTIDGLKDGWLDVHTLYNDRTMD